MGFRIGSRFSRSRQRLPASAPRDLLLWKSHLHAVFAGFLAFSILSVWPAHARNKNPVDYGAGLTVTVPFPPDQVAEVVRDVVQNGIIRGTKEYNKDEYLSGAAAVSQTRLFRRWSEAGQVFYKQRQHAIDPRNFRNSGDSGTLIVRYVVQAQGDKQTLLRINAIFVEDFRHTVHQSNGSVEQAEYKDIHDRLDENSATPSETATLKPEKNEPVVQKTGRPTTPTGPTPSPPLKDKTPPEPTPIQPTAATPQQEVSFAEAKATAAAAPQTLEERVKQLRLEVERVVKAPGAALRSAPFHTATTLESLSPGTEVLIVITTTYWVGVETHDGHHGWIQRDELEQAK